MNVLIRRAELADIGQIAQLCHELWSDASAAEHAQDVARVVSGEIPCGGRAAIFVGEIPSGEIIGFIEIGLRSHADGCDPHHWVGFIEGWYVSPKYRRLGVGTRLVAAAEEWARIEGCVEMASDTWVDNVESQRSHEALGFEVVDRCVHYRKAL